MRRQGGRDKRGMEEGGRKERGRQEGGRKERGREGGRRESGRNVHECPAKPALDKRLHTPTCLQDSASHNTELLFRSIVGVAIYLVECHSCNCHVHLYISTVMTFSFSLLPSQQHLQRFQSGENTVSWFICIFIFILSWTSPVYQVCGALVEVVWLLCIVYVI